MSLNLEYATMEELIEAAGELKITDLFSGGEDGQPVRFTGIEGIKTQSDIDRLQEALGKERNDHKAAKGSLAPWSALGKTPEEITTSLDELEELRVKISAMGDPAELDSKVETLAEGRIKREVAPLQRNLETVTGERDTAVQRVAELENQIRTSTLRDALTKGALKAKVQEGVVGDAVSLFINEFDIDADTGAISHKETGLDVDGFFVDQKEKRAWMWPSSVGGGAKGGGADTPGVGKNPWSKDGWNLTEQGNYVRQHGTEKAKRLAEAAGSQLGATRPPQK